MYWFDEHEIFDCFEDTPQFKEVAAGPSFERLANAIQTITLKNIMAFILLIKLFIYYYYCLLL